ncbi:hypothetical protein L249_8458, partial [Ophiocordyceps polyrhachis-furcata BCC 54312]
RGRGIVTSFTESLEGHRKSPIIITITITIIIIIMADDPQVSEEAMLRERLQRRAQYQPAVHDQVQRMYASYRPPLHALVFGWNRDKMLLFTEETAVGFASFAESPISDDQLRAVGQHCDDAINTLHIMKMCGVGLAGYLTYRGRKTFRFPLYTPKGNGFFNPFATTPYNRLMWHMARFASYYALYGILMGPPAAAATNLLAIKLAMLDPRMSELMKRGNELHPPNSHQKDENQWNSSPQQEPITDEASMDAERSISGQARSAWRTPSQQDAWDRVPDDMDDASPAAPSSSRYDAGNGGGSAWDRVRQQSLGGHPGQQSRQRRDAWNASRDKADPDSRGNDGSGERRGRENYSFSSSDGDKAVAKSQSQEEFDRLLERERRGIDQETGSGLVAQYGQHGHDTETMRCN